MAVTSVKTKEKQSMSISERILRYFAHGILWSILLSLLVIGWTLILSSMVFFGLFIGLIVGFIILFYAMGYLNKTLASIIWQEHVNGEWKSLVFHGFLAFLILFFIHLPVGVVVNVLFSSMPPILASAIPLLLVYPFVDGFIAKAIGVTFIVEPDEERKYFPKIAHPNSGKPIVREPLKECPYCHKLFPYKDDDLSEDGTVLCRHCSASIKDPRYT